MFSKTFRQSQEFALPMCILSFIAINHQGDIIIRTSGHGDLIDLHTGPGQLNLIGSDWLVKNLLFLVNGDKTGSAY